MKKYLFFALTLVLTAALFTGCGCTNQDAQYTTLPTSMPTMDTIAPTTEATTESTTRATTEPTMDNGNGPLEDTTGNTGTTGTTENTVEGRSRQGTGNMR